MYVSYDSNTMAGGEALFYAMQQKKKKQQRQAQRAKTDEARLKQEAEERAQLERVLAEEAAAREAQRQRDEQIRYEADARANAIREAEMARQLFDYQMQQTEDARARWLAEQSQAVAMRQYAPQAAPDQYGMYEDTTGYSDVAFSDMLQPYGFSFGFGAGSYGYDDGVVSGPQGGAVVMPSDYGTDWYGGYDWDSGGYMAGLEDDASRRYLTRLRAAAPQLYALTLQNLPQDMGDMTDSGDTGFSWAAVGKATQDAISSMIGAGTQAVIAREQAKTAAAIAKGEKKRMLRELEKQNRQQSSNSWRDLTFPSNTPVLLGSAAVLGLVLYSLRRGRRRS